MMKNRKLVKGIALAAVITALAAGGTAAYLTDFETATNSFTVGKVDIDLDEPNWKTEDNTDLVPTQVIRKDPYVANKGVNEAFVYLEVSVPVRNVIIQDVHAGAECTCAAGWNILWCRQDG